MGLFTGRERTYLGKLPPPDAGMQKRPAGGPEASVHNSMRDDFAPRRGDNDLGGRVGLVLHLRSLCERSTISSWSYGDGGKGFSVRVRACKTKSLSSRN